MLIGNCSIQSWKISAMIKVSKRPENLQTVKRKSDVATSLRMSVCNPYSMSGVKKGDNEYARSGRQHLPGNGISGHLKNWIRWCCETGHRTCAEDASLCRVVRGERAAGSYPGRRHRVPGNRRNRFHPRELRSNLNNIGSLAITKTWHLHGCQVLLSNSSCRQASCEAPILQQKNRHGQGFSSCRSYCILLQKMSQESPRHSCGGWTGLPCLGLGLGGIGGIIPG